MSSSVSATASTISFTGFSVVRVETPEVSRVIAICSTNFLIFGSVNFFGSISALLPVRLMVHDVKISLTPIPCEFDCIVIQVDARKLPIRNEVEISIKPIYRKPFSRRPNRQCCRKTIHCSEVRPYLLKKFKHAISDGPRLNISRPALVHIHYSVQVHTKHRPVWTILGVDAIPKIQQG